MLAAHPLPALRLSASGRWHRSQSPWARYAGLVLPAYGIETAWHGGTQTPALSSVHVQGASGSVSMQLEVTYPQGAAGEARKGPLAIVSAVRSLCCRLRDALLFRHEAPYMHFALATSLSSERLRLRMCHVLDPSSACATTCRGSCWLAVCTVATLSSWPAGAGQRLRTTLASLQMT